MSSAVNKPLENISSSARYLTNNMHSQLSLRVAQYITKVFFSTVVISNIEQRATVWILEGVWGQP